MARQRNGNKHIAKGSAKARPSHLLLTKPEPASRVQSAAVSAALKAKWADPEWRAALLAKRRTTKGTKRSPDATLLGIPKGMCREQAKWFWRQAKFEATLTMNKLEDAGVIPAEDKADDDVTAARNALHYALTVMRGPVDQKVGLQAAGLVLNFTKAKPASKQELTINKAEEWLAAVTADNGQSDTDEGTESGA